MSDQRPSQARIAGRTGHGRIGILKPRLTATISQEAAGKKTRPVVAKKDWQGASTNSRNSPTPPTPQGMESLKSFESKDSGEKLPPYESLPLSQFHGASTYPASKGSSATASTNASRVGTGYIRPSDILSSARGQVNKAPPSQRSGMNTQYSSGSAFTPRPPVIPPPQQTRNPDAPVITEALSDQAMEALADAQLWSFNSSTHSSSTVKLRAYDPLAYPSQQEREMQRDWNHQQQQRMAHQQQMQQHSLVHWSNSSSIVVPSPVYALATAARSLSSILRGPLTQAQQRALFEAGGPYTVDLLSQLEAEQSTSSQPFSAIEQVCAELTRRRLVESSLPPSIATSVDPAMLERLSNFFASESCQLLNPRALNLRDVDLAPIIRASGLASEQILEELNKQGYSFPSTAHLAQATGSFCLRSMLHLLVLQPLVLPAVFLRHRMQAHGMDQQQEIGWSKAMEWMDYGPRTSGNEASGSTVSGPPVVTLLQSFAEQRRTFSSVEELDAALSEAASNGGIDGAASNAVFPRSPAALKTSSSSTALSPSGASSGIQSIVDFFAAPSRTGSFFTRSERDRGECKELMKESGFPANEYDPFLSYLDAIDAAFINLSVPKPYFQSSAQLVSLIRFMKRYEEQLKASIGSESFSVLLGGQTQAKKLIRPNDVIQMHLDAAEEMVLSWRQDPSGGTQHTATGGTQEQQLGGGMLNTPSQQTQQQSQSKPHPLLPILSELISSGESFPSFPALRSRVRELYEDAVDTRRLSLQTITSTLEQLRGTILHSSAAKVKQEDVMQLYSLSGESLDLCLKRLNDLLSKQPQYSSFSLLLGHFQDLNGLAAEERKQLYHHLHSPLCTLWQQKGGGSAIYTEVSLGTIDTLLKLVGPSSQKVLKFLQTLYQAKTKLKSVASLISLAKEQNEITVLLKNKRDQVDLSIRTKFRDYLKANWLLFEKLEGTWEEDQAEEERKYFYQFTPAQRKDAQLKYASGVLSSLSSTQLNIFLSSLGVKLGSTSEPRPEDATSVESAVFLALDQLGYERVKYLGLGVTEPDASSSSTGGSSTGDETTGTGEEESYTDPSLIDECTSQSEMVRDILAYQQRLKQEKRAAQKWLQQQNVTSPRGTGIVGSNASCPQLFLLPLSFLSNDLSSQDIDLLFVSSGCGITALGRVLKELLIQRMISWWDTCSVGPASVPADDILSLAREAQAQYESCYLPLRSCMHDRFLSAIGRRPNGTMDDESADSSVLLPSDFIPTIAQVDELLDSCVLDRAFDYAQNGLWQQLLPGKREMDLLQLAGVSSTGNPFAQICAVLFHALLNHLSLLSESSQISCEDLLELREHIDDFRAEQIDSMVEFLRRNQQDIFEESGYSSNDTSSKSLLRWDHPLSKSILDLILQTHFSGQSFLFERFYERVLSRERSVRMENQAARAKSMKGVYHASHHPSASQNKQQPTSYTLASHHNPILFKPEEKRLGSLKQFLSKIERLINQQQHLLRALVGKVEESGLLPSGQGLFHESHAASFLSLLDFVPQERQLDVAGTLLLTLREQLDVEQDARDKLNPEGALPLDDPSTMRSPPFKDASGILHALGALVTKELNQLCTFLTSTDNKSSGSALLSISLQHRLSSAELAGGGSQQQDGLEALWISCDGSTRMFEICCARLGRKGVDDLTELLTLMQQANQAEIERELELKLLLYTHKILADPSITPSGNNSASELPFHLRPDRLSLQRILSLCRSLGSVELVHTVTFLQSLAHAPERGQGGKPFSSIRALLKVLEGMVDKKEREQQRLREEEEQRAKEAAEQVKAAELTRLRLEAARAERAEQERLKREQEEREREELRAQLREYLLSSDCTLFSATSSLKVELLQPSSSAAQFVGSSKTHILDSLLTAARNDLDCTFRGLEALQSLGLSFEDREAFVHALTKQVATFEVNCAELLTWFRAVGNEGERILPKYIVDALKEEIEPAQLLLEFDKDAQLGVSQVEALILTAVEEQRKQDGSAAEAASTGSTTSSTRPDSAFTSLAALIASMRRIRSLELERLHEWLGASSASSLFLVKEDEELSASEGELQRLLLSAKSWQRVHRCLKSFQGSSRQFPTLAGLSAAVKEQDSLFDLQDSDVLAYLELSGLLQHDLLPAEESAIRARMDECGGAERMQNELISIQQERQANLPAAADAAATTGSPFASSFADLMATLNARQSESIQSIRGLMRVGELHAYYTGPALTDDAEYLKLLDACGDSSLLAPCLESTNVAFTDWDLLLLEVRRASQPIWSRHKQIQHGVRDHALLPHHPRPLLLSQFDTAYLESLMSVDELLALFATERFRGGKAQFESVEALVNEVAAEVEWRNKGIATAY